MIGTTSSSFGYHRPAENGRDIGWYGTLGLLLACVGVLIASGFMG